MARATAKLPAADAVLALCDAEGRIAVRATPAARHEALESGQGWLLAKVRAKPEGGKANAAVLGLIAEALGMAPSRVRLLRGATSREKLFRIEPE